MQNVFAEVEDFFYRAFFLCLYIEYMEFQQAADSFDQIISQHYFFHVSTCRDLVAVGLIGCM